MRLLIIYFLLNIPLLHSQELKNEKKPVQIEVSGARNTQIIFSSDIKDREIGQLSFRFVEGSNRRILRLNYVGEKEDYSLNTNLQVETVDGNIYDISVTNVKNPSKTTYIIDQKFAITNINSIENQIIASNNRFYSSVNNKRNKTRVANKGYIHSSDLSDLPNDRDNYKDPSDSLYISNKAEYFDKICQEINGSKRQYSGFKSIAEKQNIELTIKGVYSNKDELYFVFNLKNKGGQPFDIKKWRLFRSSAKRKEIELKQPKDYRVIYEYGYNKRVDPLGEMNFTFVVKKFTIAKDKAVYFDIDELNGERDIYIPLFYKRINYPINYKNNTNP